MSTLVTKACVRVGVGGLTPHFMWVGEPGQSSTYRLATVFTLLISGRLGYELLLVCFRLSDGWLVLSTRNLPFFEGFAGTGYSVLENEEAPHLMTVFIHDGRTLEWYVERVLERLPTVKGDLTDRMIRQMQLPIHISSRFFEDQRQVRGAIFPHTHPYTGDNRD